MSFFRVGESYRGLYQVEYTVRFFDGELAVARKGSERYYLQSAHLKQQAPSRAIEQYRTFQHPFVLPYEEVYTEEHSIVLIRPYCYIHPLREVISMREVDEDQVVEWGEQLLKLEAELKAKPLKMYLLLDPRNIGLDEEGNLKVLYCGLEGITSQPNTLDWGSFFYTLLSGEYLEEPLHRLPPHFPVSKEMARLINKSFKSDSPEAVLSQIEWYKRKKEKPGILEWLLRKGKPVEKHSNTLKMEPQANQDQPSPLQSVPVSDPSSASPDDAPSAQLNPNPSDTLQDQETQRVSAEEIKAELEKMEQERLERLQGEFKKRQEDLLKKQRDELERRQQEILEEQRRDFEKREEELLRQQKEEFEQRMLESKPEDALESTEEALEDERQKEMKRVEERVQERLEEERRAWEQREQELLEQGRKEWEEHERKRIQEEQAELFKEQLKKLEEERLEWEKKRQELEEKEVELRTKLEQEFEQMMKEMLAKQAEEFERKQKELLDQQRQWLESKTKERLDQQRKELEQTSTRHLISRGNKSLLHIPNHQETVSPNEENSPEQTGEKERLLKEKYERESKEHEQLAKQFEDYMKNWGS